jgi:hypothetical protein
VRHYCLSLGTAAIELSLSIWVDRSRKLYPSCTSTRPLLYLRLCR